MGSKEATLRQRVTAGARSLRTDIDHPAIQSGVVDAIISVLARLATPQFAHVQSASQLTSSYYFWQHCAAYRFFSMANVCASLYDFLTR